MRLSYYPGCSLYSTAKEYNASTEAVFKALDIELAELPDWNCCGASPGHSRSRFLALALPLRNLVIAEAENEQELVLPCAACYNLVKSADNYVREGTAEAQSVIKELQDITGKSYNGTVKVSHPLEILNRPELKRALREKVVKPLQGLKIAVYYGCLLTRPAQVAFDNVEQPQSMDEIMSMAGAQVQKWSYKTDCCGGGMNLSRTDLVFDLTAKLITAAYRAGADAVVTACPLCQTTLDTRQQGIEKPMPIFYFTELLGISLGNEDAKKWLNKHITDPAPLLNSLGLIK